MKHQNKDFFAMDSILNIEVSCFANYESTTSKPVNLLTWLQSGKYKSQVEAIRQEPDKAKRDILKAQLPAITPSGLFEMRNARSLTNHSGFVSFDIDLKENKHIGNYGELKNELIKIKNVAYCGLSVSGTGLWGLIPISQPEKHKQHWLALDKSFAKLGIIIDPVCKDVCRLRGYSYDENGYFNDHATTFTGIIEPVKPKRIRYAATGTDDKASVESCINQLSVDITADYKTWFELGCSLANTFEEDGRDYFHAISQYHINYSNSETDRQYNSCLRGKYKFNIGTFFFYCKQAGIEPERVKIKSTSKQPSKPIIEYDFAGNLIDPVKGYTVTGDIQTKEISTLEKMILKNPAIKDLIERFDLQQLN